MSDIYQQLAINIIKSQESIIGPLAWSEADKVNGLSVKDKKIDIPKDGKKIIETLVDQYETLFGQASIEVCKEAARPLIQNMEPTTIPQNLQ